MKVRKESTVSKEPVLRKVAKKKRKISTPKAGGSLEKAMKNVQQIFKEKNTEVKAKKKSGLIEPKPKSKTISKSRETNAKKSDLIESKSKSKTTSKSRETKAKKSDLIESKSKFKLISKSIEVKAKKKSGLTEPKSKSTSKSPSKPLRKLREKKSTDKGIVYIGHIPHGFYEEQMKDYFEQFGKVTRIRVARSKRTGKSRGYGYVEFMHKEVAKIAAETMNNYLMCGRLLKATYIPPEKQHFGFFSGVNWSMENYPRLKNRQKVTLQRNSIQSAEDHQNYVKSSLSKLSVLESKLQERGISIKFQPVDVPQS
ncbi:PREDICTED: MKI67 FHA domain-interacting nucleolar phosphoprotein [Dinoponera quadriceps]|uniref:MKI67 FHA domain-interacting nucleolar phosphoprotein n=1 Tax=Dinoponera quadriceps TaxID=609295 RepID=A0A6P3Y6B5_DINQU|nr:PREDICTED: MKI67 FHA domain-interacting nucleolar phosphoprotein [Dinoponera quadriceps]